MLNQRLALLHEADKPFVRSFRPDCSVFEGFLEEDSSVQKDVAAKQVEHALVQVVFSLGNVFQLAGPLNLQDAFDQNVICPLHAQLQRLCAVQQLR